MLEAGRLKDRITLQSPTRTPNEFRETVVTWTTVRTIWAEVRPLKAWEIERAKQVESARSHLVTIRYADDIADDWRITFGTDILNIVGIVNPANMNEALEISCQQASPIEPEPEEDP